MTPASRSFRLPALVLPMMVVSTLLSMLAAGSASAAACGGGGRLVNPAGSTVSFSDCTVSGNGSPGSGGGVENHGTMTLTNVVISQNHADADGGGIYNEGTLTLINVVVADNTSDGFGGGIHNDGGTVNMSNVTVTGNLAGTGGGGITNLGSMIGAGIALANNTTSTGEGGGVLNMGSFCLSTGADFGICSGPNAEPSGGNSLVTGNHANNGNGGGIANGFGTVTLSDSTVDGNTADVDPLNPQGGDGGGIWNMAGTTQLVNVTISANMASGNGGGILNDNGGAVCCASALNGYATNITISGNTAGGMGGGVYTGLGLTIFGSSTIADNKATAGAGGIYNDDASMGFTELLGTLLARNGTNCVGSVFSDGNNLDTGNTCAFASMGDQHDVGDGSVGLGPLAANGGPLQGSSEVSAPMETQALASTSPAVDAALPTLPGIPNPCPATDERGVARPQDGNLDTVPACDIGAFEVQPCFTVDKSCSVESVYVCTKPITALTMQLDGGYPQCVRITAVVAKNAPLQEIDDICPGGDPVTVSGYDGSLGNDVIWNVYHAGTTGTSGFIGQSSFHLSCSDSDMNDAADCDKLEGDNKGKSGFLNIWRLAGITGPAGSGPSASLACPGFLTSGQTECNVSPAPYECTKPITALTMRWMGAPTITSISAPVTRSTTATMTGPFVTGDTVTVSGYDGSLGNDVLWDITFEDGTTGQSSFHLSCSDVDMNSADDCGKLEGDNKGNVRCLPGNDNASCINLWAFEGMQGPIGSPPSASLDCASPNGSAPVTYSYVVTNITTDPVTNVMLTDEVTDPSGTMTLPVCGPFDLGPGETQTCSVIADVGLETTDIATATGDGCSPAQSNEVTVTVGGGAASLCPTAETTLTSKDRDLKWKIEAPATNAVQISKIEITFPTGTNGAIEEVKLKDDVIFKGNLTSPGTIASFSGSAKKRTIQKGKTEELKFHFRKKIAVSGYAITVTFTNGCVVQIAN